jgi:hypothetical protein
MARHRPTKHIGTQSRGLYELFSGLLDSWCVYLDVSLLQAKQLVQRREEGRSAVGVSIAVACNRADEDVAQLST